jgi:hypothetical protein
MPLTLSAYARDATTRAILGNDVPLASIEAMIVGHSSPYSEQETRVLSVGTSYISLFQGENLKRAKRVASKIPSVRNFVAHKKGDAHVVGESKGTVKASDHTVLSYLWDFCAKHRWTEHDLDREILEMKNDHHFVAYSHKSFPDIVKGVHIKSRYGVNDCVWRREKDGSLLFVCLPLMGHDKMPEAVNGVESKTTAVYKIKEVSPGECRVTHVTQLSLGGKVPSWVANLVMESRLTTTYMLRNYFHALRSLDVWDASDGKSVGEFMLVKTKEEKNHDDGETRTEARLRLLFQEDRGLREAGKKYPFLQHMMVQVIKNKLRPAGVVNTKLVDLSTDRFTDETLTIGKGLALSVFSNASAEAAVDEWILKYPALREFDEEEVWFRPMVVVVARRLLIDSMFGRNFRVFTGAGLSMLDMASDTYVIVEYMGTEGLEGAGELLMWLLVTCVLAQLLLTAFQNRKAPKKILAREILIAVSGLKPGFDAARLASGTEAIHAAFDPHLELSKFFYLASRHHPVSLQPP